MLSRPSAAFPGQSFQKEILELLAAALLGKERTGLKAMKEKMKGVWEWGSLGRMDF